MTDLFGNLIRVTLSMSVLIACVLLCTPFLKKKIFGRMALLGLDGHCHASFDSFPDVGD